jgi:hypothetical protein
MPDPTRGSTWRHRLEPFGIAPVRRLRAGQWQQSVRLFWRANPSEARRGETKSRAQVSIVGQMTDVEPSFARLWNYRFSQPDGTEVETAEFNGDDTAETRARELSKSNDAPIVIHRHSGHIDAWEYLTEVDERS